MRPEIGVALCATGARVVIRRGVSVVFSRAVGVEPGSLSERLQEALADCCRTWPAVRSVSLALWPSLMATKIVRSSDVADSIESSGLPSRFFLATEHGKVTLSSAKADECMIALIQDSVSDGLLNVIRNSGLRFRGMVPAALAIDAAGAPGATFNDGAVTVHVRSRAPGFPRTARFRTEPPPDPEELCAIRDDDATTWLDALGASRAVECGSCVVTDARAGTARHRTSRRLAQGAAALAVTLALLAPPVARRGRIARYEELIESRAPTTRVLEREAAIATQLTREIEQLLAFKRSLSLTTLRLAEVTHALPDDVSATSVQLDSTGLQLTVRGTDVGQVAESLARTPGCDNASVMGAISHEVSPAGPTQRATIACRASQSISGRRQDVTGG